MPVVFRHPAPENLTLTFTVRADAYVPELDLNTARALFHHRPTGWNSEGSCLPLPPNPLDPDPQPRLKVEHEGPFPIGRVRVQLVFDQIRSDTIILDVQPAVPDPEDA